MQRVYHRCRRVAITRREATCLVSLSFSNVILQFPCAKQVRRLLSFLFLSGRASTEYGERNYRVRVDCVHHFLVLAQRKKSRIAMALCVHCLVCNNRKHGNSCGKCDEGIKCYSWMCVATCNRQRASKTKVSKMMHDLAEIAPLKSSTGYTKM